MTDTNMLVMPAAAAKEPINRFREKCLEPRDTTNSAFYRQLKQIAQKQDGRIEKRTNDSVGKDSRLSLKSGEQEVAVEDKQADINKTGFITNTEQINDSVASANCSEADYNQYEFELFEEEAFGGGGKEIFEATATVLVSEFPDQVLATFAIPLTLPEQVDSLSTLKPEPVAAEEMPDENSVKNAIPLSKVPDSELAERIGLQAATGQTTIGTMLAEGLGESLAQTGTGNAIPADQVTLQQLSSDTSASSAVTGKQPNSVSSAVTGKQPNSVIAPSLISPDQVVGTDEDITSLMVLRDNIPATSPISGIENKTDLPLKDEMFELPTRVGEEVKQEVKSQPNAPAPDKAVKEAPEVKQWVKQLWLDPNQKTISEFKPLTEAKQNMDRDAIASNKTAPAADIKKLIDFEANRLNASRLNAEAKPAPESKTKTITGDAKEVIKVLSRSEADLAKVTSNVNAANSNKDSSIDVESQRFNARLSSEPNSVSDGKMTITSDDGKVIISTLSRSDTDFFKAAADVPESSKNLPNAREIMAQVVQKAELLVNHKLSELQIDLKPEFLGRLTIKVMVAEGVVTARFIAENQQVKHLLETNLHTLRQNLELQGLRVDRAEVNVGLNNGGMFDGSEGSRQYLWQEGQSPGRHQGEGYPGDNQYEAMYPEEMNSNIIPAIEQDFNENGKLSFLV